MVDMKWHASLKTIKVVLDGARLLGYMQLNREEFDRDQSHAIALYIGDRKSPTCIVLYTPNRDYSCYDTWVMSVEPAFPRDARYKAIGERMKILINEKAEDTWTEEVDTVQFTIKTRTKEMRFGHHWNDCHYPTSLWEVM